MKKIRNGTFETNSSSTHSIAIPKTQNGVKSVSFRFGEFGWAFEDVDPCDYFYTAIYEIYDREVAEEKMSQVRDILKENGIEISYEQEPEYGSWGFNGGYVDHCGELTEFLDELFANPPKMVRFLTGGLVFTGNDNSNDEERCFIERCEKEYSVYNWSEGGAESKFDNPYYMENWDEYDWFWKGN